MLNFKTVPKIVGVASGESSKHVHQSGRTSSTFIYKESGESIYYLRGEAVHLVPHSLLFIPEGEAYSFEKVSSGSSIFRLINFHAEADAPAAPRHLLFREGEALSALFLKMEKKWHIADTTVRQYELLALFYRLMALIAEQENGDYVPQHKRSQIKPATEYLLEHLFDPELKISTLAALCGVSAPTFRRIFEGVFGISPRKYVIRERLTQAKMLLDGGVYKSVAEVAFAVGFDDPLYFSRLFKNHYGMPPSLI